MSYPGKKMKEREHHGHEKAFGFVMGADKEK